MEFIPFLESYNPKIKSTLIETSRLLADDETYLQEQVDKLMIQAGDYTQKLGFPTLKINFIKTQHPALQKRLIRQAILFAKGDLRSISSRHIFSVLYLINHPIGVKEVHLPGNLTVICADGKLYFKNIKIFNPEGETKYDLNCDYDKTKQNNNSQNNSFN